MTKIKLNNISAFPFWNFQVESEGMSLLDYFAAKALTIIPQIGNGADLYFDDIATEAYSLGYEMMKARRKYENCGYFDNLESQLDILRREKEVLELERNELRENVNKLQVLLKEN